MKVPRIALVAYGIEVDGRRPIRTPLQAAERSSARCLAGLEVEVAQDRDE